MVRALPRPLPRFRNNERHQTDEEQGKLDSQSYPLLYVNRASEDIGISADLSRTRIERSRAAGRSSSSQLPMPTLSSRSSRCCLFQS